MSMHRPPHISQDVSCTGKVPLGSYELAMQVIKRGTKTANGRSAYHCKFCQAWHVGSDGGVNKSRNNEYKERRQHG